MKAIILASGKGTRLESLGDLPKALLTVSGKTLIERQLDSFLENKIHDDIILAHSDVIYDFSLFKRIVNTKKSHVTVSRKKNIRSKDLKAEVSNGKVIYIGLSPKGSNTFL